MKNIARRVLTTMVLVSFSAISSNAAIESDGNFIDDFDSDTDGVVSQSEFQGPEDHFSELDADDSGYIDADEAPAGPPGGDHASNGPEGGGPEGDGPEGGGPEGGGPDGGGPGGGGPGGRA